jgi:hypothetical protein
LSEKYTFPTGIARDGHGLSQPAGAFGLDCACFLGDAHVGPGRSWPHLVPDLGPAVCQRHGKIDVLEFDGYRAAALLAREVGTHLFVGDQGRLSPIQAAILPLTPGQSLADALRTLLGGERAEPQPADAPSATDRLFLWRPVVAVYTKTRGLIADPRSGLTAPSSGTISPSKSLLATLPLPAELAAK